MLARLQRLTTAGVALLVLACVLLAWRAGHPGWAVAGAALAVFGHGAFLATELALAIAARGQDPSPPPSFVQLARAWGSEVFSALRVFCWQQPFRADRFPDHVPAEVRGRRGLLLVHGFICNRGFWNPWLARLSAAGAPFVAVNLEPVFGSIDDYTGLIDAAVRRLEAATGMPPVAVAHSMGGLALRHWWALPGNDGRLAHAVSIASPHHGTGLARFARSPNTRQMAPGSPWLRALEAAEPPGRAQRFTCFHGHCDNVVFPPATATLAGADNRHLAAVAHIAMASRPEPWEEVLRRLSG